MTKFTGDTDSDNDGDYTPAGRVPRKPRLFTVKLAPQSVFDWYNISLDKSTARRNSTIKEEALGHLLATGWKIYPFQKKTKQELRYKSLNGRVYISLRTACKAYIDQADATAVPTTSPVAVPDQSEPPVREGKEDVPSLKKPEECGKSPVVAPMRDWGNKKPPAAAAERGTTCKAYIDQADATAVPTTAPVGEGKKTVSSLKKPEECVKSPVVTPMRNWGNKKPRPPTAAARGNRNPRTALFHLIEQGIISPGDNAYYKMSAAKDDPLTAWGSITNEGLIKCDCCSVAFSISKFEAHTGSTKHRPAANIFLEDGRSLLDCQNQLITQNQNDDHQKVNKAHNSDTLRLDKNDSICSICHFGGELILCDLCPAAFHSSCLGCNDIPFGDWFCPSCICNICGQVPYNFDGVSSNHQLDSSFVKCVQCEQSFHIGCVKNIQILEDSSNQSINKENWFCTKICEDVHMGLQELLWKQIPLQEQEDNYLTWTLMKYTNTMAEHHRKKLNIALGVMHESFRPVKDPITKNDIIQDVILSTRSEVKRLNFEGFYTVVLEMNNIVTTVATVRVYGDEVAEVPFVATRSKHRRCGLCRTLMNQLELQLMKLGVKRLTLPAVDEALNTWTSGFGFSKMTDSDKLEFVKYTFLGFQHTVRCHKNLEKRINPNDMEWGPRKKLKQTDLEDDFFSYMCLDNWNSISDAF